MVGLEKEITRCEAQKAELLDVCLNQGNVGKLITRQEYETKAAQIAAEVERLKAQLAEMQQRNRPEMPSEDQAQEALRLLKAIKIAAKEATFAEKRTILRLLDARVFYTGERLEMSGGVPVRAIDLDKLLKDGLTGGTSSLPPQSSPSADSPAAETDMTSGRCTRSMDSTLWFYKSLMRFSVTIPAEKLRKPEKYC